MLLTHEPPPSHHHHHHHHHQYPHHHHHHHHHHPNHHHSHHSHPQQQQQQQQQQQRDQHKSTHPMSSSDRPTLPGIASILAFAAQDPPQLTSPESSSLPRPNSTRLLQSSDPLAHALPAFAPIPSFLQSNNNTHPSPTPLFDSTNTNPNHYQIHIHRRRSSSITIVQEQPSSQSISPSSSAPTQNSTPSQPSRNSFLHLCHPSNRPFPRELHHFTPDPQSSNPSLNNSIVPPHTHNYHLQTHISHDALQPRHSDRISAAPTRSKPSHHHHHHHPLLPGRSTPPNQQHHRLNLDHSRQPSFIKTDAVPTPPRDDRVVKHIRRPSNASQSSSSSISGSVSVSSDFGASSLSIGSQSNLNRGPHPSSSSSSSSQSININNNHKKTFSTSCNDSQSSQTEPLPRPPEEDEPNKTFDERRGYNHPPHQQRSHDDTSGLQNHRSASGSQCSPNHQHSLSPLVNPLSSRLVGGPMINNNNNNTNSIPTLGYQNHRYQCMEPGCAKTFSRPSSLKIHSYSHTGQKPFKCMRCDRAFSVQSNLKRHQKVHEKRSVAEPARSLSTVHLPGGLSMALVHASGATGGRPLISEESGDEDHEGDLGMYHQMEE